MTELLRGQVIRAEVGQAEPKRFVVVSNNSRNRNFDQVLTVRMTTTPKRERPSIVQLGPADRPHIGAVVCDDIETIWADEVVGVLGGLTPATMRRIDAALMAALGIEQPPGP